MPSYTYTPDYKPESDKGRQLTAVCTTGFNIILIPHPGYNFHISFFCLQFFQPYGHLGILIQAPVYGRIIHSRVFRIYPYLTLPEPLSDFLQETGNGTVVALVKLIIASVVLLQNLNQCLVDTRRHGNIFRPFQCFFNIPGRLLNRIL